jgi:hypothetical protein
MNGLDYNLTDLETIADIPPAKRCLDDSIAPLLNLGNLTEKESLCLIEERESAIKLFLILLLF